MKEYISPELEISKLTATALLTTSSTDVNKDVNFDAGELDF